MIELSICSDSFPVTLEVEQPCGQAVVLELKVLELKTPFQDDNKPLHRQVIRSRLSEWQRHFQALLLQS